jgi:PBP1b-binding outer membrane lipoprotein LpoB
MKIQFILLLSILFLLSCTNQKQEESVFNAQKDTLVNENPKAEEDESDITLPSPAQIAVMFNRANLKYAYGLTAQIANDKTGGTFEFALRLGIYSADLFYCLLNKQSEEAKKYYLKCYSMSEKIGMQSSFSDDILNRLMKNIDKKDSVIQLLSLIQSNIDTYTQSENKEYITYIAFTGGWIESIYIATKVFEQNTNNKELSYLITEQLLIGNTLLKALKKYEKNEPNISKLISDVQKVMNCFNQLQSIQQYQNQEEDTQFALDKNDLLKIIKEIETIRQLFIQY